MLEMGALALGSGAVVEGVFGNNVIYSQDQGYSFLGFRILNPEFLF